MSTYNTLTTRLSCPHCDRDATVRIDFRFGLRDQLEYEIGDRLAWDGRGVRTPPSRPKDGHFDGEGYTECPLCGQSFWLCLTVRDDVITGAEVDHEREDFPDRPERPLRATIGRPARPLLPMSGLPFQSVAMSGNPSRVEKYLGHLDVLSGGAEPQFWPVESTWPGHHGVTAIGYRNMPEDGLLLGFTYGLSLAEQDEWRHGKPELSICVQSDDAAWVLAIAHLAERLRHDCLFSYGDTINFGEPIASGSPMDGFVVSAPIALEAPDAHVEVGDDHLPIHIVGMYPIYGSERRFISQHGLEAFWTLDWDPYNVTRPPAA